MVGKKTIRSVFNHIHGMQRPAVLKWWLQEIYRRQKIKQSNQYCDTTLLSYPRSGNHALRFILEAGTSRPTLGAGDCDRKMFPSWMIDRPLFLRKAGASIKIRNLDPVAVKRHGVDDILLRKRLILVVRDPVECIVSHTRNLSDDDFQSKACIEVKRWLSLIYAWRDFSNENKLLVPYSLLISDPLLVQKKLLTFIFDSYDLEIGEKMSSDSQGALGSDLGLESATGLLVRQSQSVGEKGSYYHDMFPQRSALISASLSELGFSFADFMASVN